MFGDSLAPELNACVVALANQSGLKLELKVLVFLLGDQELVFWNLLLEVASDYCAFLDAKVVLVAFLSLEGFTIEEGTEIFRGAAGACINR
jgi:hypothetical protein